MKVLLVNGSPHQNGCTATALKEIEEILNKQGIDTENFWIGTKPVAGCIGCGSCLKAGKCFIEDKVNLTNWGPHKIERELENLNMDPKKVKHTLASYDDTLFQDKNGLCQALSYGQCCLFYFSNLS